MILVSPDLLSEVKGIFHSKKWKFDQLNAMFAKVSHWYYENVLHKKIKMK